MGKTGYRHFPHVAGDPLCGGQLGESEYQSES